MTIKSFCVNMKHENTYVVYDDTRECVIIDCGCFGLHELYELTTFIDGHGLKVKHLLCTHFHLDHTFGNDFVWFRYGVRAEANEADRILCELMHYQAVAFGLDEDKLNIPSPAYTLADGATISFGHCTLKVVTTPGHSPGGVCLYDEKNGVLFSGDTLLKSGYGATNLPGARLSKLYKSITDKLFSLPDSVVVYPGHGATTTIGAEKASNPILVDGLIQKAKKQKTE